MAGQRPPRGGPGSRAQAHHARGAHEAPRHSTSPLTVVPSRPVILPALWKDRSPATEAALLPFLSLEGIQHVYLHGHRDPQLISPDNWNLDFRFVERPGARRVQLDLFYDYRTNVALYPKWQAFLRQRRPRTLIFWGQSDIFFTPAGGEAYLADLPEAEIHRLDSGHFAIEDSLELVAREIKRFYAERVAGMAMAGISRAKMR